MVLTLGTQALIWLLLLPIRIIGNAVGEVVKRLRTTISLPLRMRVACQSLPYMAIALTIGATALLAHGQENLPLQESPLSAGEIAMSVRRRGERQVIEVWRRALREGGPHERAAVARVAHVGRVAVLAEDLGTALQQETEYSAAQEEAGKRLGNLALAQVALVLARARGAVAISAYLKEVRPALDTGSGLRKFFRIATLKDSSNLL